MFTVGNELVPLEPFTAFIVVLSESVTVHIYDMVGAPVSTSQAIVGAVLGIGIIKGMQSVNTRVLIHIVVGWLSTPLVAGVVSFLMFKLVFVLMFPVK
jgi:PiT family inorganic phosphate transporter